MGRKKLEPLVSTIIFLSFVIMIFTDILNLIGLIFNITGSILLAISLSKFLASMHFTLALHDMQIQQLIDKKDKVIVGDVSKTLTKGSKNSKVRTSAGLIFLVIGSALQLIPFLKLLHILFMKEL